MTSARAEVLTRRTYNRPLDEAGEVFETWAQTVDRVIDHQLWLWERALGRELNGTEWDELDELALLMKERKVSVSGRTLWLGGTAISKTREASQFNCSFLRVETVHDVVDALWLLLQGCGVGFEPVVGTLNGFTKPVEVEVFRSERTDKGRETNKAWFTETGLSMTARRRVWVLSVGDSAESWAKAAGKILAMKEPVDKIVLDFSEIRPAGSRLAGYGWISSGDEQVSTAFVAICELLNARAGQLLTRIDILDVLNWLGTILSSRRSAEIALVPHGDSEWREFAAAKKDYFLHGRDHRAQSNNSLLFYERPTREQLEEVFAIMQDAGGSEPGFVNAVAAKKRAPWFKGVNPCLAGDTLVRTENGCVPIKDLAGSTARLYDDTGALVEAPVRRTGEAVLTTRIEFADGKSIRATRNHLFILANGERRRTDHLAVGDVLMPATYLRNDAGFEWPTVAAIEYDVEREDVYCAGVSTTASFDLAFIHSGNCAEILLGNKSFCNLVEVDLGKFNGDEAGLHRAIRLIARANYRQTCVNLDDGVLQRSWHELNEFLRLCGVGLTGIVRWEYRDSAWAYQDLRFWAAKGANSMADELGLPHPKAVTTIKPSGTLSKIMDTTEGIHRPLGRYIFNNVKFSVHDSLVPRLEAAGYRTFPAPGANDAVIVTFPVAYEDVEFDVVDGVHVNLEPATSQLERYKLVMRNYVDHNCSITVSYSPDEVPAIIDWLMENWDDYVGVSFLYRTDPTKTAADLGYQYLPQEVVTKETYDAYVATLKPLNLDGVSSLDEMLDAECATGACPIR